MAEINDYLSITGRNSAQQNISITKDRKQAYVDALEALLQAAPLRSSVSAIVVDAVIKQAQAIPSDYIHLDDRCPDCGGEIHDDGKCHGVNCY